MELTPRFGAPGNVVGTANFSVITSAATPRNLQFGTKLIWKINLSARRVASSD